MRKLMLFLALLVFIAANVSAQAPRVTGQVLFEDEDTPCAGATVRVKGTKIATATDVNGYFTLTGLTPPNDKELEISYIGYQSKTVRIAPDLKVYLTPAEDMMDEVIVVAFGKQKRESFTGSASVVGAQELARLQVTNPIEALNGNVSGLQMLETNSYNSDPTITIRGIGSINASTQPLIVLDGLPYSGYWNDINPADVASITVLKDAASTALYGARGANGVILITSKNAQRGNTRVTATAKWGAVHNGRENYDVIDNPGEYYEAFYLAQKNYFINTMGQTAEQAHINANNMLGASSNDGGLGYMVYTVPGNEFLIGANGKLNPNAVLGNRVSHNGEFYTLYPDNWSEQGLRTGLRQEYNVNLSGGNDRFTFYGSLGYLNEEGISYGSDVERITARVKAEYKAYPWLRVGTSASYNHLVTNTAEGVFTTINGIAPIYPLYLRDANGRIMYDKNGKMFDYGDGVVNGLIRPAETTGNSIQGDLLDTYRNVSNSFNISGFATFDLPKDIHFTANASVYVTESRLNEATDPYYGFGVSTGGYVRVRHQRNTDTNFQQLLSWTPKFGDHSLDVLLGHEYSRTSNTYLRASRYGVAMYDQNQELDGAIIDGSMTSYIGNYNVEGYFLRAQYDYASRYFASGSFRRDGSSHFAPGHRWGNFWSLGGAWIISREEWFPKTELVNMLKLKLSYGEQGNDGIGNYMYIDTYNIKNTDGEVAYVFRNKGNENITWETTGSLNAGVEFELFNSRLNGGVEVYKRTTRDMLMQFSTPMSLGYTYYYDNVGDMANTGVEIDLNGDVIRAPKFTWNVGLNFTWEHNEVTKLPIEKKLDTFEGYDGFESGYCFYGEGLPVNTWLIPKYAGVDDHGQAMWYSQQYDEDGNPTEIVTTTDYEKATRFLCGTALPKIFGGFNTSIKFFGFDIAAQFNYSIGGKKYDSTYADLMTNPSTSSKGFTMHRDVFKSWSESNRESNIPIFQANYPYSTYFSDRFLTDGSYISFKNLSVGYTIPSTVTRRFGCNKLRVYGQAENICYWTKRKGFDPRMGSLYANYNSSSGYSFPKRIISGGVSIEF